jgi:two-component system nitrogen regulation response regulator GlnG
MKRVLIIDDEESICWGLKRVAQSLGADAWSANSVEQALQTDYESKPDAIMLDVRLPGEDGISAMHRFRERWEQVPIIVMTAFGDLETAVRAVKNGAFQYLVKPFDTETVRTSLEQAFQASPSAAATGSVSEKIASLPEHAFIAHSAVMQEVFNKIALAADSDAAVLLQGESGTGKELAALAIHRFSRRADQPLVVVNVAALSPSLAESELFGHVRGAFTGAQANREGLLAQADGGTLFLDEVAEIPLPLQAKLLRALEQKEYIPVGANKPLRSDFRLIAATHQDMSKLIASGEFREDLYFRLSAFPIDLPPLRARPDDIEPLAEHFLRRLTAAGRKPPQLSPAALQELQQRNWRGNVRELRNVLEHALIVSRGQTIQPEHLSRVQTATAGGIQQSSNRDEQIRNLLREWTRESMENPAWEGMLYEKLLELVEQPVFEELLAAHDNQVLPAARLLGLHRTTLRRKIDRLTE